jgi:hypothetical protein
MAILRIHSGLDTMPDDTKDKVIAPKISRLRAPAAPDISAERKPLLDALILNFTLSLTLSNKNRQFTFNVIRKAQDAFEEYCRAVHSLNEYVAARPAEQDNRLGKRTSRLGEASGRSPGRAGAHTAALLFRRETF